MPINVRWYNEDRQILHYQYVGMWTWDEAHDADQRIRALLASLDEPIDLIYDLTTLRWFPLGVNENARKIMQQPAYPNLGLVVVVGKRVLYDVTRAVFRALGGPPVPLLYAPSIQSAVLLIRREREARHADK